MSATTARGKARTPAAKAKPGALKLRTKLDMTQMEFAPLLPVSVRSLATLEAGTAPANPVARRLVELDRLTTALAEVIRAESLGRWL